MFSHVMLGCSDRERSKKFYDALFPAMGGKAGTQDAKGRLIYAHNGGVFLVSKPSDGGESMMMCANRSPRVPSSLRISSEPRSSAGFGGTGPQARTNRLLMSPTGIGRSLSSALPSR